MFVYLNPHSHECFYFLYLISLFLDYFVVLSFSFIGNEYSPTLL